MLKADRPLINVSQKYVPPLTCYNHYIHGSTAVVFGKNAAEKVGSQNALYFPISPKHCLCTTCRGNRKPGNCVFSLKCCMLFYQKTRNTV